MEKIINVYEHITENVVIFTDAENNYIDSCNLISADEMDTVTIINEKFNRNCLFRFVGEACEDGEPNNYTVTAFVITDNRPDATITEVIACNNEISAYAEMVNHCKAIKNSRILEMTIAER